MGVSQRWGDAARRRSDDRGGASRVSRWSVSCVSLMGLFRSLRVEVAIMGRERFGVSILVVRIWCGGGGVRGWVAGVWGPAEWRMRGLLWALVHYCWRVQAVCGPWSCGLWGGGGDWGKKWGYWWFRLGRGQYIDERWPRRGMTSHVGETWVGRTRAGLWPGHGTRRGGGFIVQRPPRGADVAKSALARGTAAMCGGRVWRLAVCLGRVSPPRLKPWGTQQRSGSGCVETNTHFGNRFLTGAARIGRPTGRWPLRAPAGRDDRCRGLDSD